MRQLVGTGLVLTGIALAIFVGGYLMLYGGAVQCINGITADPVDTNAIVLGGILVLFCEVGAFLAGVVPVLAGIAVFTSFDD